MSITVEKKDGESNESLMRRFTKKVQSSKMLISVKSKQFKYSKDSENKVKKNALAKQTIKEQYDYLRKSGKLDELSDSPAKIKKYIKVKKK